MASADVHQHLLRASTQARAESKLGSRPKFQKAETSVPPSPSCMQRTLHTVGVQATVLIN